MRCIDCAAAVCLGQFFLLRKHLERHGCEIRISFVGTFGLDHQRISDKFLLCDLCAQRHSRHKKSNNAKCGFIGPPRRENVGTTGFCAGVLPCNRIRELRSLVAWVGTCYAARLRANTHAKDVERKRLVIPRGRTCCSRLALLLEYAHTGMPRVGSESTS